MKEKGPFSTFWPKLSPYLKPYLRRLIIGVLAGGGFATAIGAIPLVAGWVFGVVFDYSSVEEVKNTVAGIKESVQMEQLDWLQVLAVVLMIPLVFFFRGTFDYISSYFLHWTGQHVIRDIRVDYYRSVHKQSLQFFSKMEVGQLISRMTYDIQQIEQFTSIILNHLSRHPLTLILLTVQLFVLDPLAAAVTMFVFPLCILPIQIYGKRVRRATKRSQQNVGIVTEMMHESITGIRVVKAFGREESEVKKFYNNSTKLLRELLKVVRSRVILEPLIVLISGFGFAAAFVYFRLKGYGINEFVRFAASLLMLYEPAKKLGRLRLIMHQVASSTERLFEIIDLKPDIEDKPDATLLTTFENSIVFQDVSFSYDADIPVLKNINVEIPRNKFVALVGASGAGKSTFVNLIPRFYEPTSGCIQVDGKDYRDYKMASLRAKIGVVTQDTILFHDTIRNNLMYGNPDASDNDVKKAAQRAYADEFILEMQEGYETVVGEKGFRLSGGQKQRLAIARAILKDAPILILDEAMSSLDTRSEKLIQKALDEFMGDRTVIAIAHRLSTVLHADEIIVMDKGEAVERGSHEELLKLEGIYSQFYKTQFFVNE